MSSGRSKPGERVVFARLAAGEADHAEEPSPPPKRAKTTPKPHATASLPAAAKTSVASKQFVKSVKKKAVAGMGSSSSSFSAAAPAPASALAFAFAPVLATLPLAASDEFDAAAAAALVPVSEWKRMTQGKSMDMYMLYKGDLDTLTVELTTNPHGASFAPLRLYLISDLQELCLEQHGDAAGLADALRSRAVKRAERSARKAAKPPKPYRGPRCKSCKAYLDEEQLTEEQENEFDMDEECCFGLCAPCCCDSGNSVAFCPHHNPEEYREERQQRFEDRRAGLRY